MSVPSPTCETFTNRIFLSGFPPCMKEEQLQHELEKFGPVISFDMIACDQRQKKNKKRKRQPFAFVTFASDQDAQRVITYLEKQKEQNIENSTLLFNIAKFAQKPVERVNKRFRQSIEEKEKIEAIFRGKYKPNMVLQVHSSHLHRMIQYIHDLEKVKESHAWDVPKFVGSSDTKSKNISFIYAHVGNENEADLPTNYWYNHFVNNKILIRFGVRKIYVVDKIVEIDPSEDDAKRAEKLVDAMLCKLQKQEDITLKIQSFPMKKEIQHQIVASLDRVINEIEEKSSERYSHLYGQNLDMATSGFTHLFSSVQIFNPRMHEQNMKDFDECSLPEIFLVGIQSVPQYEQKESSVENQQNDDDEICRAYFKLQEAMDNYRRDEPSVNTSFQDQVGFDCGSSPGGWTKWLIADEGCKTVYSCDPGLLDESILKLEGTRYMQMKGFDAIETLKQEGCNDISVWVSDMCLQQPTLQINHLLQAKKEGILAKKSFFILTLKFNTGHSKETFDFFAEEEVKRLKENAEVENVRTYHLFSNRKGERTIMGIIK